MNFGFRDNPLSVYLTQPGFLFCLFLSKNGVHVICCTLHCAMNDMALETYVSISIIMIDISRGVECETLEFVDLTHVVVDGI